MGFLFGLVWFCLKMGSFSCLFHFGFCLLWHFLKKNKERNAIALDECVFSGHHLHPHPTASLPTCLTHVWHSRIDRKVSPWSGLDQVTLSTALELVALSRARERVRPTSIWTGSCIPSATSEQSSPRPSLGPARLH